MAALSRPITGGSIGIRAVPDAGRHMYLCQRRAEFQHVISRFHGGEAWRRLPVQQRERRQRTEIVLKPVGAAARCGDSRRSRRKINPCAVGDVQGVEVDGENRGGVRTAEVMVAATATVVLGVANRVLYKLALVPLKQYPFFLAQLATFGYVIVYSSILFLRYHAGKVTYEMLSLPKSPFLAVGLLEALGAACGMAAGATLCGAAIPVLSQSFLVWQLFLSWIFLGRRYSINQLFGCFFVAMGVIATVASGSSAGSMMEAGVFWSLLMIVSFLFQAADTVLKEMIFLDAARKLKGGTVDLFVVNTYGSAFQAVFISLLLPFLSKLWGIPFLQLPAYLKDGAACFLNLGTIQGCDGAPLLPVLFVIVNMGFNISLLHLIKISSAVVSCLVSTFSVPISVFLFTLPLPYLGAPSPLPPGFILGAAILVLGMLVYAWTPPSLHAPPPAAPPPPPPGSPSTSN